MMLLLHNLTSFTCRLYIYFEAPRSLLLILKKSTMCFKSFIRYGFCKYFLPVCVVFLAHFINSVFQRTESLNFEQFRLSTFKFKVCVFVCQDRSICPPKFTNCHDFFQKFYSFQSMVYFILLFVCRLVEQVEVNLIHMDILLFQHHLLKRLSLGSIELPWYHVVGLFLDSSLFH